MKLKHADRGGHIRRLRPQVVLLSGPQVPREIVCHGALNSKPFQQSVTEFKKNIVLFCVADWGCFVPAQALNFFFVPPRFRFLYVCGLTVVYDVFLSFILHRDAHELTQDQS